MEIDHFEGLTTPKFSGRLRRPGKIGYFGISKHDCTREIDHFDGLKTPKFPCRRRRQKKSLFWTLQIVVFRWENQTISILTNVFHIYQQSIGKTMYNETQIMVPAIDWSDFLCKIASFKKLMKFGPPISIRENIPPLGKDPKIGKGGVYSQGIALMVDISSKTCVFTQLIWARF